MVPVPMLLGSSSRNLLGSLVLVIFEDSSSWNVAVMLYAIENTKLIEDTQTIWSEDDARWNKS